MGLFVILASKWTGTDTAIVLFLAVGIVWVIVYAVRENRKKIKKELEEPFPCPYCEATIYYDKIAKGRYSCFECRRTVIHGRDATAEEFEQSRKEEADCAAVRTYLKNSDVFVRIMNRVRIPNLFIGRFSAYGDKVKVYGCTRTADPYNPLDAKMEDFELDPVPLGFRIETEAGEAVFHNALFDYIQNNYSHIFDVHKDSSRTGISIGVKE